MGKKEHQGLSTQPCDWGLRGMDNKKSEWAHQTGGNKLRSYQMGDLHSFMIENPRSEGRKSGESS